MFIAQEPQIPSRQLLRGNSDGGGVEAQGEGAGTPGTPKTDEMKQGSRGAGGPSESECAILLILNLDERVQDHRAAPASSRNDERTKGKLRRV